MITNKSNEQNKSVRVIIIISIFKFIFVCIILTGILFQLHLVSKLLQSKNISLLKNSNKLQKDKENIKTI